MAPKASQVYVIDNDDASREALTALVQALGIVVHSIDSVDQFFSQYDGHRPACIVADMSTPGINGIDLLLRLRRQGLSIPIVIRIAHADTRTTVLAMKYGAFTTLDKSCKNEDLWDAIRDALREDIQRSKEDQRRQDARDRLDKLTPQERDVLSHLLDGKAHKVIALRLKIGLRTVEARRKSVFVKAKVASIADLVKLVLLADPDWAQPSELLASNPPSQPVPDQS